MLTPSPSDTAPSHPTTSAALPSDMPPGSKTTGGAILVEQLLINQVDSEAV